MLERGGLYGLRRLLPLSRDIAQITAGLIISNVGNAVNIVIMGILLPFLIEHPIILGLLPSLASLRGSVAASMASRASTLLHLGIFKPEYKSIFRVEGPRTLALTLISSMIAAVMIFITTGFVLQYLLLISVISGILAYTLLIPLASFVAARVYARGIDPDNVMTPLVMAMGDIVTLPLLALATLFIVGMDLDDAGLLMLVIVYVSLVYVLYLWFRNGDNRRVIGNTLIILIVVAFLGSFTGAILVGSSKELATYGLLHATPAFLSFSGAIIAIASAKQATVYHLYGPERVILEIPKRIVEGVSASIVPGLVLVALSMLLTTGVKPYVMAGSLVAGILLLLLLLTPLSSLMTVGLSRVGLDPDNVIIPLVTTVVDLMGIPLLLFAARILV
ncbi:MAG: magnesium transporter [Desulfurococcales archaeon]|nr:magnesium transporter [Desulfurococcales archaeon]